MKDIFGSFFLILSSFRVRPGIPSSAMSQGSKLFVHGVNENCPREVLEKEFGRCGEVTDVYNNGRGYAFVTMKDENAAQGGNSMA